MAADTAGVQWPDQGEREREREREVGRERERGRDGRKIEGREGGEKWERERLKGERGEREGVGGGGIFTNIHKEPPIHLRKPIPFTNWRMHMHT